MIDEGGQEFPHWVEAVLVALAKLKNRSGQAVLLPAEERVQVLYGAVRAVMQMDRDGYQWAARDEPGAPDATPVSGNGCRQ